MITLQGMADHRFTSVSLSTNVFLGEIIKKNWKLAYLRPSLPFYDMKNIQHLWKGLAARAAIPKINVIFKEHQGIVVYLNGPNTGHPKSELLLFPISNA